MSKLSLGRGRGRPRKPVVKPTFEDFPVDGSLEEQKIYQKQKTTKLWRYNKLSGSNSAEFRKSENTRVKTYQKAKKQDQVVEESSDTSSSSEHKKKTKSRKVIIFYIRKIGLSDVESMSSNIFNLSSHLKLFLLFCTV